MTNSKIEEIIRTRLRDVIKITPCGLVFFNNEFITDIIIELISIYMYLLISGVEMLTKEILKNISYKVKRSTLLFFTHLNNEEFWWDHDIKTNVN